MHQHQQWWMFSGLYDGGRAGGWTLVHIVFSGRHTIRLWGSNQTENVCSQTHTCIQIAYWSSCFSYVWFFVCLFCFIYNVGAGPQRADTAVSDKPPKISESSCSHSRWVFDGQQQNIAKCVSSALKGRFRCTASSWDQQQSGVVVIKHKERRMDVNSLNNQRVTILCIDFSVFSLLGTYLMEWVCWWVPHQAGERWRFYRLCCSLSLIWLLTMNKNTSQMKSAGEQIRTTQW